MQARRWLVSARQHGGEARAWLVRIRRVWGRCMLCGSRAPRIPGGQRPLFPQQVALPVLRPRSGASRGAGLGIYLGILAGASHPAPHDRHGVSPHACLSMHGTSSPLVSVDTVYGSAVVSAIIHHACSLALLSRRREPACMLEHAWYLFAFPFRRFLVCERC